jgi:4-amino-4-deoxy-L-arabinose transferase-like glycosyltransferase
MQTPEPLPPEPAPRRRFAPWALAIFLLALGLRLLHLWALSNSGLFYLLMGDARRYHDWAMAIAHGAWVGEGVFYQAPLYPYVLGVVYTLFGDSLWAARILQALLGSLACVFVADAGRRLFSRTAGVISGLALAIYAPAIFYDSLIQKSSLDLLLLSLILWLISRLLQGARGTTWLWLGLALGGLCLTRENALIFIPLLLLWLVLAFRQARPQRLRHGVLFLAGVAIVLLPVALRNLAVGGEFHLTTSQSGPNLYIGNNAVTDGVYAPLRFGHGSADYEQADAIELAEAATGRKLSAGEVSRYWAGRAFDFMRTQPGRWLALVGRKFLLAWNSVEAIDTEDLYTYVDKSPVLKIVSLFATFGLIAPLGVLGAWRTWAQRRSLWILYALFATYLLTLIAFFVLGRYRLPMAILLALFAGQGVAAIPELLRARGRALLVPLVAFILTAAVAQLPLISKGSMRAVTSATRSFVRAISPRPKRTTARRCA